VHFFDPNFGHFRFPNRQVFREKLKPFWRYAYMNPAHPEPYFSPRMQIQRILPGPIPEKTFIPGGVFQQKWFSIQGPEGSTDEQIAMLQSLEVPAHLPH
jgi:hypothetical protein